MSQMIEFAGNNLILVTAMIVILALILKTEIGVRLNKIPQLSVNDAVRLLNDDDVVVLDVREANEYSSGHLRDAIHIPISALNKRISELEKHKNKKILAYCRSGNRSNTACRLLSKQGFENVNNMSGGIIGWSSANLPLSKNKQPGKDTMPQAEITVYYAPFCPYCTWAKQLLDSKEVEFTMVNVNENSEIRQQMEQRAGRTSVPQIFIGDTHVGGYDELAAMDDRGELDSLIAAGEEA